MRCVPALIVVALLAACAPAAPAATATPALTATQPPTFTPAPAATAEPTATPTLTPTPSPTPGPGLDDLLQTPGAMYLNANLDGASQAYEQIATLYPHRAEPYLGLAAVDQRNGDVQAALTHLREAADAQPTSFEAWRQLAVLLEQQADFQSAVDVYGQMIDLVPDDPDLYTARAIAEARLGLSDPATSDLQSARRLDPYREFAWLNAAGAAFGARAYAAAAAIATAGLDGYPQSVGLLTLRAQAELTQGDAEAALSDFDIALAAAPNSFAAMHGRGLTLLALNRSDEAIAALQQAGEMGTAAGLEGFEEGLAAMADAADAIAMADPVAAFSYLDKQTIHYGSRPALLLGVARVRWRQGNDSLALSYLNNLVRDGYTPALYWRARVYIDQKDDASALDDLRAFIEATPAGPLAESARTLISSLGG